MIRIEKCENWEPGTNCFNNNASLMGQQIGRASGADEAVAGARIMAMMSNFINDDCWFLMLINEKTGERVKVFFEDEAEERQSQDTPFFPRSEPIAPISPRNEANPTRAAEKKEGA